MRRPLTIAFAMVAMAATAFSQPAIGPNGRIVNPGVFIDAFQVNFLQSPSGSPVPTAYIDITNTGALGASPTGPGTSPPVGNICVNVYAFAASQQELQCCSCLVSPNALFHLAISDLVTNGRRATPTPGYVVKLLATVPGPNASTPGTNGVGGSPAGPFTNTVCNAAGTYDTQNLAPGMRASATKLQTFPNGTTSLTETQFSTSTVLSPGELTMMTNLCQSITGNFSGGGTCPSCPAQ